jgi:hypothetical protein
MQSLQTTPKNVTRALIGFILSMPFAFPCMSATLVYSGDTTGAATWTRPSENGNLLPTDLSGAGTDVNYQSQPFYVDANGSYNFLSIAVAPTNWDNYLFLYQNDSITGAGNITAGTLPVPFDFSPTLGIVVIGVGWQSRKWLQKKHKKEIDLS